MKRPLLTSGLCCNIILSLTCGPGCGAQFLHQHLVLVNIEIGVGLLQLWNKCHFTLQTKLGGLIIRVYGSVFSTNSYAMQISLLSFCKTTGFFVKHKALHSNYAVSSTFLLNIFLSIRDGS